MQHYNMNQDVQIITLSQALNKIGLIYAFELLGLLLIAFLCLNTLVYLGVAGFTYFQVLAGILFSRIIYSVFTRSIYLSYVSNLINILCLLFILFIL